MKPKCSDCIFWRLEEKAYKKGTCRATSPQIIDKNNHALFPITFSDEFCGEFNDGSDE